MEGEAVDMGTYSALGVITGKSAPDRAAVTDLITDLKAAFDRDGCTKADIVKIISGYLPNFRHIETERSLDGKM